MGELNQSQGRKTTKLKKWRFCSIQNLSALENVLRTGTMAMLCTTETQIEEIWKKEKPEAQAEAKGNIEMQHPRKPITMQQCRCYDSKFIAEKFFGDLHQSQSPVGLFELEFCSTGVSISFSSSLAGFAALCKLRYGPPSTLSPRRAMAPRFSLPWKRTLEVHASCGAHASG